jgi:hypothetical protein
MDDLTKTKQNNLVNLQKNYFQQYGEAVSGQQTIVGSLLKFSKGHWLKGAEEEEVVAATKFVVNMDEMFTGFQCWKDNKPVEHRRGKISEGWAPPKRAELGDMDQEQWELDTNDKPRDPWQFNNWLLMKPVGKRYSTDVALTFITSSQGGISAVGKFTKAYGDQMAQHEDEWPIIEIGSESYKHSNKEFGRIEKPILTLVGWEKKSLFVVEDEEAAAEPEPAQTTRKGRRR